MCDLKRLLMGRDRLSSFFFFFPDLVDEFWVFHYFDGKETRRKKYVLSYHNCVNFFHGSEMDLVLVDLISGVIVF